jgi:hypothetical protein
MGAWGAGLYANDSACDVRDGWLEKLRQGASGEEATAELLKEWDGADGEPLFWLALADTQWTWGRLETQVRERAKRVLENDADLPLWEQSKDRGARMRVLDALAERLKHPPPPPKAIRVRGDTVAWKRGQLWAYRTLDGKYVVFRVAAFDPECGLVGAPVTELLDIVLDDLPPAAALVTVGARPARADYNSSGRYDVLAAEHRASPMFEPKVKRRGELPRHRLKKLRAEAEPRPATATTKTIGVAWDVMDEFLPNKFDIGGPRLGTVHGWALPDGGTAYTVVERMTWPDTLPATHWQLGVLDCRGDRLDGQSIEGANVLCSIVVMGFLPASGLRETGYRAPTKVHRISGAIHDWASLPRLLEKPDGPVTEEAAMKALLTRAARQTGG